MTLPVPQDRFPRTLPRLALAVMLASAYGVAYADDNDANDNGDERASVSVADDDEVISDYDSEEATLRVTQMVSGLEHPWSMAWLPDDRMLVTERPGNLYLIDGDEVTALGNLPEIDTDEDQLTAPEGGNQGGLLDVAVHPDYADNGWIYFTYSSPGDDDGVTSDDHYGTATALARARLDEENGELTDVETLYAQSPRTEPGRHYGSRISFPGDGSVLFSIGDRGLRAPSQDLSDPAGSLIRLLEDGGAHPDNPFVNQAPGNLRPEIYSFGHRNKQGLAIHPDSGELWAIDHGPSGGDLLYRLEAGANYGWPQVAFGSDYSTGEFIGIGREAPGVTEPAHWWEDSMAPSGMAFYSGDDIAEWQGNLFVGSLYREQLHRLVLDGNSVAHEEVLLEEELGRIRDVRQGPDGMLYVLTDESDGGLYRLSPAD
ncbi:PQQ-dependent sugar dehydrogenase [Franzmannia qiaohouensis]|uniref:PQQ-dependent sugar dehydrogenase n=1 Tax=Franzmannia qiaohouensis TaxID=1329370 RepID=A0ABU1HEQ1_9GAMM|nr:PQQ-dependent sugar dehydrogenase [Halomonas qiaohouensis]MDR5905085.1 PQQ-dependent sugar dehydrogenase [Halomonas qiaohouensis]